MRMRYRGNSRSLIASEAVRLRGGSRLRAIGIIGRHNSGKTHLIVRLIAEFQHRGVSIATIKHTHHHLPTLDVPGKDSFRYREAGAHEIVVASDHGWTLLRHSNSPATLAQLLAQLTPVDLVLIEGYKQLEALPRIEVFRGSAPSDSAAANEPLATTDRSIAAIACPTELALPDAVTCPRIALDDTRAVTDLVLALTTSAGASARVRIAS